MAVVNPPTGAGTPRAGDPAADGGRDGAPKSPPRRRPRWRRAYNLVVLSVTVTLMNIWVGATLPVWSYQIQRDKEAQLIFRGLQYAEAIRVFQTRNGRKPTRLRELIEVEPRSIRQLWPNPMREDGRWGLIPDGQTPGQPLRPGPGQPSPLGQPQNDQGGPNQQGRDGERPGVLLSEDTQNPFSTPATANVPIRGVFDPEGGDAAISFLGKEDRGEWHFTVELVSGMQQGTPDNPSYVRPFLAKIIGRPWPPGITPLIPQPSSEPIRQAVQQPPGSQNNGGNELPSTRFDIQGESRSGNGNNSGGNNGGGNNGNLN